MKEVFVGFAKYNEEANQAVYAILDKLSNDEREKDRGSYYGSLSGLARHLLGGTIFFGGMFNAVVPGNAAAMKALSALEGLAIPEGKLDESGWKSLGGLFAAADSALVNFVSALTDGDFKAPLKIDWYGGNPAEVPLYFMLQQLAAHGTHHRGQLSQILDELKIDNDYSGINVQFLA
ncbi:MAG: damage-inducible protein DinB [Treponema sp.]|jgi:uncharacterized damage-inducible protein DinB|nr:damage-inducible protein DinB [Treponema sp.]